MLWLRAAPLLLLFAIVSVASAGADATIKKDRPVEAEVEQPIIDHNEVWRKVEDELNKLSLMSAGKRAPKKACAHLRQLRSDYGPVVDMYFEHGFMEMMGKPINIGFNGIQLRLGPNVDINFMGKVERAFQMFVRQIFGNDEDGAITVADACFAINHILELGTKTVMGKAKPKL